jgi:hypothetical protein
MSSSNILRLLYFLYTVCIFNPGSHLALHRKKEDKRIYEIVSFIITSFGATDIQKNSRNPALNLRLISGHFLSNTFLLLRKRRLVRHPRRRLQVNTFRKDKETHRFHIYKELSPLFIAAIHVYVTPECKFPQ